MMHPPHTPPIARVLASVLPGAPHLRSRCGGLLLALIATIATAADRPTPYPCLTAKSTDCGVTPEEMKEARAEYKRGVRLKTTGRADEALAAFKTAALLVPRNAEFAAAREFTRQALVLQHIERGNQFLAADQRVEALAEFSSASDLDPENEFARQRVRDALGDPPAPLAAPIRVEADSPEVRIVPEPGMRDFHLRSDARSLVQNVLRPYGIAVTVDDSVTPRPARFDLERADYATAVAAVQPVTKTFFIPLGPNQLLAMLDSPDNRLRAERMSLVTFYLPDATGAAELNDIVAVLRSLFDLRYVVIAPNSSIISVRGAADRVRAATRFIESLRSSGAQVLLDVRVYEVTRHTLRTLGVSLPLQFQMFNLSAAALALTAIPNAQDLINQLIASGGINQTNAQAIQALLAQLGNQNQNSLFNTPFATFGGGLTRFGVAIPAAQLQASFNESNVSSLEHLTLRAGQNVPATFMVGTRYPILNASFAPIFNTSALSSVIANGSFQTPFPSFTYEDLGITLKATPLINSDRDVTLKLELAIRSLTGETINSVPVISNRQYSGSISLRNGEPAVVIGMLSRSDQRALRGLPGLGQIPGARYAVSTLSPGRDEDELILTITPHIASAPTVTSPLLVLSR